MALYFKKTMSMVLGKTSDLIDNHFEETESFTDSAQIRTNNGELYIDSTTSATIPFGNIGVVRHFYLKGNVKSRLLLNGTIVPAALVAGSNSMWHFYMRTSATSATIRNSTTASGRYEYRLIGS